MVCKAAHIQVIAYEHPCCQEPVGQRQSQDRCKEIAPAEGREVESHDQPVEHRQVQGLYIDQREQPDNQEGIERDAFRRPVLVGPEEQHQAQDDTQQGDALLHDRKGETGDTVKDDKGRRHHSAADTNEQVAVVDNHHEPRGNHHTGKLDPQGLLDESAQQPYHHPIECCDTQCQTTLGNVVLCPFDHLEVSANVATEILISKLDLLSLLK